MNKRQFSHLVVSFLVAVSVFSSCFAQNQIEISGTVIERRSGSTLPYAHIGVRNSSIGTVSNELGQFKFIVPYRFSHDTLVISYIGYETYRSPISAFEMSGEVYLDEAPVILKDVVINAKRLSAEKILYEAVENLLQNASYPTADFKLEGFYREVQRTNQNPIFLVESAFDIYDNSNTRPLTGVHVKQFRKILHTDSISDNKRYNHNNLLRLFDTSTNFVVLAKQGLKAGKTTWAIGKRPYEISKVSEYNDREVYIITHDNDHVSLKIVIDANNFAVLRNEYVSHQAPENFNNYFWKYRRSQLKCGFYKTHQVYEYREFHGKMYPYFFYRNDCSKCFDDDKGVISASSGSYQALITKIELGGEPPKRFEDLKKHRGMQEMDFRYDEEFWSQYNIIRDLPPQE